MNPAVAAAVCSISHLISGDGMGNMECSIMILAVAAAVCSICHLISGDGMGMERSIMIPAVAAAASLPSSFT